MSEYVPLLVCILFIGGLFAIDRKLRPMSSKALWIPLLWFLLVGTRPPSYWINGGEVDPDDIYAASLEGSPLDRNFFLLAIICGLIALCRKTVDWSKIFSSTRGLFVFFVYCGISIIWSDYPFPSVKKYIKEIGNIVVILVMIAETNPVAAVQAVFSRYISLVIPLSAVLILFFPDVGTYFSDAAGSGYRGVTTNKNELGSVLALSGIFLLWDLMRKRDEARSGLDILSRLVLLGMTLWLLVIAQSATSLVCMVIGSVLLLCERSAFVRRQVRFLPAYFLVAAFAVFLVSSIPDITDLFFNLVGRDMTFTGRTDIWQGLLQEPINPLLGTGFQSFWLRPGILERMGRFDFLNEAHNGYLEIYLNGGLLGLAFLLGMIVSAWSKLKRGVLQGCSFSTLFFSYLIVILFYNLTEASFGKLGLPWFVFLVGALSYSEATADGES
jgi:exopolysaccharide production protein ExoQ